MYQTNFWSTRSLRQQLERQPKIVSRKVWAALAIPECASPRTGDAVTIRIGVLDNASRPMVRRSRCGSSLRHGRILTRSPFACGDWLRRGNDQTCPCVIFLHESIEMIRDGTLSIRVVSVPRTEMLYGLPGRHSCR